MSEQQSNNPAPRRGSFMDKIRDTFKPHHSEGSSATPTTSKHQYGWADTKHDNAFAAEANIVGAHAIPPMTFHADRHHGSRSDSQDNHVRPQGSNAAAAAGAAAGAQVQAQALSQGQSPSSAQPGNAGSARAPFEEFGDRYSGTDLHSAGSEKVLPTK
ncbi:hypothetical protein BGZ83_010237 [Gryganskiella cystojenkinii]|nr:hypothetical protein BGZ83_010237 [Gryganskiella cystojenkinii]